MNFMESIKAMKEEFASKELYYMLTKEQRETLPVLTVHYKGIMGVSASVWEDCGLIRCREIKKMSKKVFSIKYNRKELLKHAVPE